MWLLVDFHFLASILQQLPWRGPVTPDIVRNYSKQLKIPLFGYVFDSICVVSFLSL